ncbi:MAG: hypothetical protein M3261_08190 [Thermoproteota archaeon]|nr:hypothetical protein [Thermoproteota archaeon]
MSDSFELRHRRSEEKKMMQATVSDSNYSDAESLLEWDDERAAEFVAAEKKKREEEKRRRK